MADHVKWCHICPICQAPGQSEKLKDLEKVLPPGYAHLLCLVEEEEERAMIKVRLSSREEVDKWFADFQLSSGLTWRKARTYPVSGMRRTYRVDLRCQHKTYYSGPKDTNCPATLSLVLKRNMEDRRSRSTDGHMAGGYLLYVNWRNNHNHPFGHSRSSAVETIMYDLQEEESDPLSHRDEAAEAVSSLVAGSTSETEVLERRLDDFVGKLKRKLQEDDSFRSPVKAFLDTFSKLHTDAAVWSALLSTGKPPRAQPKGRGRPRGPLQTSTAIGVQPTAVSRRKAALGGRGTLGAGGEPLENPWSWQSPEELQGGPRVRQTGKSKACNAQPFLLCAGEQRPLGTH